MEKNVSEVRGDDPREVFSRLVAKEAEAAALRFILWKVNEAFQEIAPKDVAPFAPEVEGIRRLMAKGLDGSQAFEYESRLRLVTKCLEHARALLMTLIQPPSPSGEMSQMEQDEWLAQVKASVLATDKRIEEALGTMDPIEAYNESGFSGIVWGACKFQDPNCPSDKRKDCLELIQRNKGDFIALVSGVIVDRAILETIRAAIQPFVLAADLIAPHRPGDQIITGQIGPPPELKEAYLTIDDFRLLAAASVQLKRIMRYEDTKGNETEAPSPEEGGKD